MKSLIVAISSEVSIDLKTVLLGTVPSGLEMFSSPGPTSVARLGGWTEVRIPRANIRFGVKLTRQILS